MSSAEEYVPRYTVADYGSWKGEWELWAGIPVSMTPSPFGPHQVVTTRLARLIGNQLEASQSPCEVIQEIDWIVRDDTVVRPDIVVVCGGIPEKHVTSTPALVVEVLSQSTADKDRTAKRRLYEEQNVPHYMIVDPERMQIDLFALDESGNYQLLRPNQPLIFAIGSCEIVIEPKRIFAD